MATLTKYKTFKSLKQHSAIKVNKAAIDKEKEVSELEAFLQIIGKTKVKKA